MLMSVSVSQSFLLEDYCLVAPPCDCANSFIYCNAESLSKVPTFLPARKTIPFIMISLMNNFIRVLDANDFQELQTAKASSISINLGSNNLEVIDDNAFAGIEQSVRILYLSDNWLEYLPPALGKLTNLAELEVANNNIKTFDPAIFAGFGSSLKYFDFGVDYMYEWPTAAINNLHALEQLYVVDTLLINWTIPANALDGVKNTLTSLYYDIGESDFTNRRLPVSFCGLNRLRILRIYLTAWINSGDILFDNCNTIMSSMESLQLYHIQNINITQIFTIFPSLTHLNLAENYMSDFNLAEYNTGSLLTLRLSANNFGEIPRIINKLTSLQTFDFGDNYVTSIQDDHFSALANLESLDLSYNLISYISPKAFAHNPKLSSLNLEGNKMTTVPALVSELPALNIFHFSTGSSNQFTCSCQSLANLASWKVGSLHFPNVCNVTGVASTMSIKTFIQTNLQVCP